MKVTIDPYAGFCFGVKNAIELAERELQKHDKLYCIGDIVHNQEEINRLRRSGLEIVDNSFLQKNGDSKILFRAHGEPPATYDKVKENELTLIDGTCPIVLKLQQKIKTAFIEMQKIGGQVIIFGSKNHPEVIGLSGYTDNEAIIINSIEDVELINFKKPIRLFAQTTQAKEQYNLIKGLIQKKISETNHTSNYKFFDTICGQVSNRVPKLKEFCINNEVIVFVSGKKSSNGKFLFDICRSVNLNSYFVSSLDELAPEWFEHIETVGISGATSTPSWLMEDFAKKIKAF